MELAKGLASMFTKNTLIAILLTANTASAAVIAVNWSKIWPAHLFKRQAPATPATQGKGAQDPLQPLRGAVKGAIQERASELQACYNSYLETRPLVKEGYLRVLWTIDSAGQITSIEPAENEFMDSTLRDCIVSKARAWTLPIPAVGRPLIYAHRFSFRERALPSARFDAE